MGKWVYQNDGKVICSACGTEAFHHGEEIDGEYKTFYYPTQFCQCYGANMKKEQNKEMTKRLTKQFMYGFGHKECYDACAVCDIQLCDLVEEMLEKLASYEDLEEQGRLVILPEKMTLRKLLDILSGYADSCPSDYNLTNRCELSCFECWLAALKGENKNE